MDLRLARKSLILPLLGFTIFFLQGLGAAWHDSPTDDEPTHLTSGYVYWKTGLYWVDVTAPPLSRLIATAPLLFMPLDLPVQDPTWLRRPSYDFCALFCYSNRISPDILFLIGRLMILLLGIPLVWTIWVWADRIWGSVAASASVFYVATSPPLLASGHLVTTDFGFSVTFFLTLMAFWFFLQRPDRILSALLTGVALGAAFNMKYSSATLFLILPCLFVLERPWKKAPSRQLVKGGIVIGFIGVLVCLPFYATQWKIVLEGYHTLDFYSSHGWAGYLLGHYRYQGWPGYFLAVLLFKTPILLLALFGVSFWMEKNPQKRRFLILWMGLPSFLFLGIVSFSRIQVGVRHILPLYPLVCLSAGAATARIWERGIVGRLIASGAMVWSLAISLSAFPNYIAYFGELAGGSANGYRVLADSNCDWGQELKALAIYLQETKAGPIYLSYFGNIDPSIYGIRYEAVAPMISAPLAFDRLMDRTQAGPVLLAVSATNRQGLYYKNRNTFRWLDTRRPIRVLGYTMFIYDITQDAEAHRELARMYLDAGLHDRAKHELKWADWIETAKRP